MENIKRVLSYVRRGVDDYNMIEEGDRIAVGVSGGKDSLALLETLAEMRRFYPKSYEVVAITVDMGFEGADYSEIEEFCRRINVKYVVQESDIAKIVFDIRKEPNPCSLCAKLRRGLLHSAAQDHDCNKVALGHHFDDAVETFMMNLMHEGRIGCFEPVTAYENIGLTIIRPLCYTEERLVKQLVSAALLPVVKSLCPEDGHTERQAMHDFLMSFEREHRGSYRRIFGAIERKSIDGWFAEKKDKD